MSGVPKKSHEESTHSSSSKYPHEDSVVYPKIPPSASSEYHLPSETGPDSRVAKIPRTESRDADRRSPLPPAYRRPYAAAELPAPVVHASPSENKLKSRDSKETRDFRFENRDKKTETREPYSDVRKDTPSAKVEKDVRHESRGDDNKEVKSERESHTDGKAELKAEGYGVTISHSNYKESKDYHRGKLYSDPHVVSSDTWHRGTSQSHVEVGKEVPTAEEKDHVEAHEAFGENRYDSKGEDKFKDKDRKRKELKLRDWGERDKERSDRRSNVPVANSNSSGDFKDSSKEERDSERWERERRDASKDKEIVKERERDHTKRDAWTGAEKDGANMEKEVEDRSIKTQENETLAPELKRQKDTESWKTSDKRRDRDGDAEVDRPLEKRFKTFEKEPDDGCADGEAVTDKEREVHSQAILQRKRMQRSRAAAANRELRFKSQTQDNEGSQGKSEIFSVVYKVGECMQELIKLWKEHEASQGEENGETSVTGPTLEIRIPSEHVTATNRQVRGGQLWGTDIYTDDSDLVAVLMHTGYCRPTASPPPSAIQELRATVRILPPQDSYISTLRNNVRSRAWGAAIGCSYRVERCCIVKKAGGNIDLEPCLTHTSTVEPTIAPVIVERTMTTRAAASNALRQQRFVREVTIQYNLCNEPWIKYSISIVADKGLKKTQYTSARLKKGEVLYLETHSCRYELCFNGEKVVKASQLSQVHEGENEKIQNQTSNSTIGERNDSETTVVDVFRWSRCKKPLPQKVMRSLGIPLPLEHVEVLEENIDWEDVQWSQTGVWIAGKEYSLARVHFLSLN